MASLPLVFLYTEEKVEKRLLIKFSFLFYLRLVSYLSLSSTYLCLSMSGSLLFQNETFSIVEEKRKKRTEDGKGEFNHI